MSELEFQMGRERIGLPADRLYTRTHMWLLRQAGAAGTGVGGRPVRPAGEAERSAADGQRRPAAAAVWRVGLSAFAVTLLRDVFFLDWEAELEGAEVSAGQEVGAVESAKAVSSIHSPLAGRLLRFNHELLDDPSLLNADCYGRGWLFELAGSSDEELMSAAQYREFLSGAWPEVQRKLKGRYG